MSEVNKNPEELEDNQFILNIKRLAFFVIMMKGYWSVQHVILNFAMICMMKRLIL
jgi:hypothetical protein